MSTESSFNRAAAVAHYLSAMEDCTEQFQATAKAFSVCADAIHRAVIATAIREYLHAVGLSHEPALEVLIAAAKKFRIPTETLQAALDEHLNSMEAL